MFERFTDRARRAVVLAQEESRHRGHRVIDVGHIALGALTASEGAGLAGDTVEALRRAIDTALASLAVESGYAGHIPFTEAGKAVLGESLRLSLQGHRNHIDSHDVLLAALEQPDLAGPLATTGIDLARVRTAIATERPTDPEGVDDNNETIIALLHQILQRLDTIAERLERDT